MKYSLSEEKKFWMMFLFIFISFIFLFSLKFFYFYKLHQEKQLKEKYQQLLIKVKKIKYTQDQLRQNLEIKEKIHRILNIFYRRSISFHYFFYQNQQFYFRADSPISKHTQMFLKREQVLKLK